MPKNIGDSKKIATFAKINAFFRRSNEIINRHTMGCKAKILYVCEKMKPYLPDDEESVLCRALPQAAQESGMEIRTFMPRFGVINERRNQLHEVIRLSGMNIVIDDNDHQLIIKVASIPSARMQVYFIDNEDLFQRKAVTADAAGTCFADNDERSIFFARGVIETVNKLRWASDIVHCHGWFSALMTAYVKAVNKEEPLFENNKVVLSLYGKGFTGTLDTNLKAKLEADGVSSQQTEILEVPTYENLIRFSLQYCDALIVSDNGENDALAAYAEEKGVKVLKANYNDIDSYLRFYDQILDK